jgi:diacylglycerol kinase family enzyme
VPVGGDGTLNELLNGLPDPGAVRISPFSCGTANMLAQELSFPAAPADFAAMVEAGREVAFDVGRAEAAAEPQADAPRHSRRFLLLASAGFDALVTRQVRERRSGALGYRGYLLPILQALRAYRPSRLRLRVEERDLGEGGMIIAGNTRNYGGIFSFLHHADAGGGSLAVCLLERTSRLALLSYALSALLGRVDRRRDVRYAEGRRIEVTSAEPVDVQVDGDHLGWTPASLTLEPRQARILAPARAAD